MRHALFCYGTLQEPTIIKAIIKRGPPFVPGTLKNYACYQVINQAYPGIRPEPGKEVDGLIYQNLSSADLNKLDLYEGDQYQRIEVALKSSSPAMLTAWAYVFSPEAYHQLSKHPWDLQTFKDKHLASYLRQLN